MKCLWKWNWRLSCVLCCLVISMYACWKRPESPWVPVGVHLSSLTGHIKPSEWKENDQTNHYVHVCDLFVETALADVTASILGVRLLLQYDRRLIQQVILSQRWTVLQVHKVGDVELREESTVFLCLIFLYGSIERLVSPSFLSILLHLTHSRGANTSQATAGCLLSSDLVVF